MIARCSSRSPGVLAPTHVKSFYIRPADSSMPSTARRLAAKLIISNLCTRGRRRLFAAATARPVSVTRQAVEPPRTPPCVEREHPSRPPYRRLTVDQPPPSRLSWRHDAHVRSLRSRPPLGLVDAERREDIVIAKTASPRRGLAPSPATHDANRPGCCTSAISRTISTRPTPRSSACSKAKRKPDRHPRVPAGSRWIGQLDRGLPETIARSDERVFISAASFSEIAIERGPANRARRLPPRRRRRRRLPRTADRCADAETAGALDWSIAIRSTACSWPLPRPRDDARHRRRRAARAPRHRGDLGGIARSRNNPRRDPLPRRCVASPIGSTAGVLPQGEKGARAAARAPTRQ